MSQARAHPAFAVSVLKGGRAYTKARACPGKAGYGQGPISKHGIEHLLNSRAYNRCSKAAHRTDGACRAYRRCY